MLKTLLCNPRSQQNEKQELENSRSHPSTISPAAHFSENQQDPEAGGCAMMGDMGDKGDMSHWGHRGGRADQQS